MELTIRAATEDDAGSIVAVLNPLIEAGTSTIMTEQLSVADQVDFIRGFPRRGIYNVAVCNDTGSVVGLQDVQPISTEPAQRHVGEISTFVALGSHRTGVGRRLTGATLGAAKALGFRKIMATIRADSADALAFYRDQGFAEVGTLGGHALVGGKYLDEVLAERWIVSDHE